MRQRHIKGRDKIIEECGSYLITGAAELKGRYAELFQNNAPIKLELGSGKGQFITTLAGKHPEFNYIACEGAYNVYPRILQKAKALELPNLLVLGEYVNNPEDSFAEGEISGIYLNFSDPWKPNTSYRRLTYRSKLEGYKKILAPGSRLEFKTDNDELFEFSLLELEAAGLKPDLVIEDLHASSLAEENIMTEYEEKFSGLGMKIKYFCVSFP